MMNNPGSLNAPLRDLAAWSAHLSLVEIPVLPETVAALAAPSALGATLLGAGIAGVVAGATYARKNIF